MGTKIEKGVMRRPAWAKKQCPFCFEMLGKIEFIKRVVKKKCICNRCRQVIDERHVIW